MTKWVISLNSKMRLNTVICDGRLLEGVTAIEVKQSMEQPIPVVTVSYLAESVQFDVAVPEGARSDEGWTHLCGYTAKVELMPTTSSTCGECGERAPRRPTDG